MNLRARSFALFLCAPALTAGPILLAPSPAIAQEDPMIKMARERFQEGVKFYDQKKYEAARAAFLQAYALKKHPAVLLNLAQSEVRSGHEADAAKHFSQFLRENTAASPAEKSDAEGGLIIAKSRTEEVTLSVDQPGAEVFVDGQSEGFAPLAGPVYVMPGSHTLEARKGGKTVSQTVNATAGTAANLSLDFAGGHPPAAVAPVPAGGGGPATTPPPAGAEGLPPPMENPPPGEGAGTGGGISMDTSGPREPFIHWATRNKLAWVGGGVTVLGLGVGIGFALGSQSAYSNADTVASQIGAQAAKDGYNTAGLCSHPPTTDYQGACQLYEDDRNKGDSQKTVATVGFILAGAAAAGTVVYYFIDSKPKKSATGATPPHGLRAGILPIAGPTEQGLGVVGEF